MKCHLRQINASDKKHIVNVGIKVEEQKENDNQKQIQANDEETDVKVNTDLLTTDYFANNCAAQQDDEQIVIVDKVKKEFENGMLDKKSYVNVPPMATRPEFMNDNENGNANTDEAVEIFWPVKQME